MNTIIVDDDYFKRMQLDSELSTFSQLKLCGVFECAQSALHFAQEHRVELAFIKIPLPESSDRALAGELRRLNGGTVIIFVSDSGDDICTTIGMDADYFILRPYIPLQIEKAVRRACIMSAKKPKRIFIKTFGNFGVYVDGKPLHFSSKKAKELLAYLVDRNGNLVDTREGFSTLWEDRAFTSSSASCYRKVLCRMLSTLEDVGAEDMIRVFTRGRAIDKRVVDCDYFSYLAGDREVIRSWNGEYMSNYSWAESTLAWLEDKYHRYYSEL